MMNLSELIKKNRSTRRFYQDHIIERQTLVDLVDLARYSASGGNKQPLKFFLSCDPDTNAKIFEQVKWAGYLEDWDGPVGGEKPTAYILIIGDKDITDSFDIDHGIAAQSIMLGAVERGLGGCIMSSIKRVNLMGDLKLPDRYHILLVLALGKPKESVVVDDLEPGGDIKYWRDNQGVHHVPKRTLDELILD